MSALGIEAESPQSRFWACEDLQRKARPAGKHPNKNHKINQNLIPYVRFKTSYRPALGEHCRKKY